MFRTAQITFRTSTFGGEIKTDIFRVEDDETNLDIHRLTKAVHQALHDAGERDFTVSRWSWAD